MKNPLVLLSVIVGVLLIILAFIYFTTPANSLPGFLPGHDLTLATPHHKHAIASLLLGLAAFAFAWFQSGSKSSKKEKSTAE